MNDDDLRVMLHERAASMPDAPERLVDLHRRIRRDRRRRSTLVMGGLVAALAAVVTLVVPRLAPGTSPVAPADPMPSASSAPAACARVDVASATSSRGDWQLTRAWTATTTSVGQPPAWSPVPPGSIPAFERPGLVSASTDDVDLERVVDGLRAYGIPFGMYGAGDTPPDEVGDAGNYVYYSGVRLTDVRFSGTCEPTGVPVSGTLRAYSITGGGILQCSVTLPTQVTTRSWAALAAQFCPVGSPAGG